MPTSKREYRRKYLQSLYEYFEDPYLFEHFVRILLMKMGLEDVEVTRRSKDGGVDVIANRQGIAQLSDLDAVKYFVQVKRYKPESHVSIKDIKELRGSLKENFKGMFVTTGKFGKPSVEFLDEYNSPPIILVDGDTLVHLCEHYRIGVTLLPVFNRDKLDKEFENIGIYQKNSEIIDNLESKLARDIEAFEASEKLVTLNDTQHAIMRIPNNVLSKLPKDTKKIRLIFLDISEEGTYNIVRGMVTGLTAIFRKSGLIQENNQYIPKIAIWLDYSHGDKSIIRFRGTIIDS